MNTCCSLLVQREQLQKIVNHKSQFSESKAGKAARLGVIASILEFPLDILFVTDDVRYTQHQIELSLPSNVDISASFLQKDLTSLRSRLHSPIFISEYGIQSKSMQKLFIDSIPFDTNSFLSF